MACMCGKKREKPRKIFRVVFRTVMLSIACVLVMAAATVIYFTVRFVLMEKGQARVEVLEQISDVSSSNRHSMENVMDMIYGELYPQLVDGEVEEQTLQKSLDEMQELLDKVGIDATIDVVINARKVYMTDNETDESIRNLLNSYWYIKHYSGETAESWNLRFVDVKDISSYYLSYGRTVYDRDGKSAAVIVINTSQKEQFRALQKLVGESDKVYILDQNGIVVCHSKPQMVGTWLANMNTFSEKYGYNDSRILQKNNESYMVSNYHDPESNWTFVEEQNISNLLTSVVHVLATCILTVIATGVLVILASYVQVQRALRDLTVFTESIGRMDPEELEVVPVQSRYQEVTVLGSVFNHMVVELQKLIVDIQNREAEKLRSEYDFLQTQLNPHFMHNTLIAIKSLMAMGRLQEASNMMSEFVELIYIPTSTEIPMVPLREEIHLLDNFVSIMNCRTVKDVAFVHNIPERLLDIPVPRMILQPIVGNSFFHGFADRESDCRISITAAVDGKVLEITVEDNGEGVSPARLQEISTDQYASVGNHHGVGIQNVKKRLGIVYGGSSNVIVQSIYRQFTRVILRIDGYDHPLMNLAAQRIVRNDIPKEEKYEDLGS